MRVRQRVQPAPAAPAPPPEPTPVVPSVEVAAPTYPEKARKLHREERPCRLPSCIVTWTPASKPFCDFHWQLLPWDARAAYENAYRRKSEDSKRRVLTWMVGWLLYFFEFNSVTMPPTHKPGWSGKEFTDCPCTACARIRARARATALLHEGRKGNTTMGPILRIHMELGRACPKSTTPKDLGLAGMEMEDDTDVVRIELLSGEVVRVKGTETVAALKKLPKGSSAEEAAKVLLSERAS